MYCGGVPLAGLHPGEGEVPLCLYGWVGYLRRTARALMTRGGIAPDHAEPNDRHSYREEKRRAFDALAAQIERVLALAPNVVQPSGGSAVRKSSGRKPWRWGTMSLFRPGFGLPASDHRGQNGFQVACGVNFK
jgi:hypothetical protein